MAALFLVVLLRPRRTFFALKSPDDLVWLAAFGIAAIVWSFARLFVPGEQPIGPRRAFRPDGVVCDGLVEQPNLDGGQILMNALPMTLSIGT